MLALELDLGSLTPIYQQIADGLRALVARGELAPGVELPSVRQLGAQVGVNLNTVARAYRLLAEEGLIELRQGASARVRGRGAKVGGELLDEESRRKLADVLSRWALKGATRREAEQALRQAAEEFFGRRS